MDHSRLTTEQPINAKKFSFAKDLRHTMTIAEKHFWYYVRRRRIPGYRFRRQQVIDGFIVDFYCSKLRAIIELDGNVHDTQKDYDNARDKILEKRGLRVLRFSNDAVIRDVEGVVRKIFELCARPLPPRTAGSSPPPTGGGTAV